MNGQFPSVRPGGSGRWRLAAIGAAVAVYAGLGACAVLRDAPELAAIGLLLLVTVLLWPALAVGRRGVRPAWAGIAGLIVLAVLAGRAEALLDTLAVIINAGVGWLFVRSLRPGREPLVTRFARAVGGAAHLDEPGVRHYTQVLTRVWAGVMWGQALVLLGCWLALHALPQVLPPALAPWLHGYLRYGSYLVIVLLFVLEPPWRRHRLPQVTRYPFLASTRKIAASWQSLTRGDDP